MGERIRRSLRIRFERASNRVQKLSSRPSKQHLLDLYALYKQANSGDCIGRSRGILKERMKWKAWNSLVGTSEAEAMKKYCKIVDYLVSSD
jgi:diazepam-binding inhibitor (GABA receptor modulating acyl-CoA-binding protein)|tara:strand:+ start:306 stop:578 length:273 start_codon:yes stop_codon:yes gene_type:complete